jgi:hypothetical protein
MPLFIKFIIAIALLIGSVSVSQAACPCGPQRAAGAYAASDKRPLKSVTAKGFGVGKAAVRGAGKAVKFVARCARLGKRGCR